MAYSVPEECKEEITGISFVTSDLLVLHFEPNMDIEKHRYLEIWAMGECCDTTFFIYDKKSEEIEDFLLGKKLKNICEGECIEAESELEKEVRQEFFQRNFGGYEMDMEVIQLFPITIVVNDGEKDESIQFYRVDLSNGYYSGCLEFRMIKKFEKMFPQSEKIRKALLFLPSLKYFSFHSSEMNLMRIFLKSVQKNDWYIKITPCTENYLAKIEVEGPSIIYDNRLYGEIGYRHVANINELEKEIRRLIAVVK